MQSPANDNADAHQEQMVTDALYHQLDACQWLLLATRAGYRLNMDQRYMILALSQTLMDVLKHES